ncbi:SET domain-containing protein [Ktedonobacter racemifer]|uniref:Nuclear protein SET n=1 Tax=Ktedonobacter racemifer DSM 44963 TaxID=485913 RepID=D6U0N0_KTERA|nr:SET domain-containing protein-lysine N-methyltransferase [Ktedonobacter racemifer]EFH82370.1 nuclear protein SET [Ktedonobacter racemifer DSM 44963]
MPSNIYLSTTWYDPRAEVQASSIHGMGMVASQPIHAGEVVVRIGGTVMTEEEFQAYTATVARYNAIQIGEGLHLVDVPTALGGMNHSCDANLWMRDEATVVARRDIAAGEELTQDYALYTTSPSWTLKPCCCGTPVCRQVVTGNDWQRPEVQERYRDHFSPFLNERIRRLRGD